MNESVAPLHTIVANTYTLLLQVSGDAQWYSVLNLKDAFSCIPLHPDSQYACFEWTDPKAMIHQQYTGTVLPQGFRDSPHLFARVLEKDLRELQL